MNYSSISIIYNPNSTGSSYKMAGVLKKELEPHFSKIRISMHATKYAGHAERIAFKCAHSTKNPLIISVSGDGGYNEVINGAMRAQEKGASPICAVAPAGNANDHRRTTKKLPLISAIKKQKIEKIDLLLATFEKNGKIKGRYAHSYIGLGFTPVIAVELNKKSLNSFNELWIVLKTFYKVRPFKVKIHNQTHKLDGVLFTNISQMAKILTISKKADIKDGKFEVVTFPHRHKLKLAAKLFKAALPGLEATHAAEKFTLIVLKAMPIQLDGEVEKISNLTRLTILAKPQYLRTIR